jgi:hypothetical protein
MSTSVTPVERERQSKPPHPFDAASTFVRPTWAVSGTSATVALSHGKLVAVPWTRESLLAAPAEIASNAPLVALPSAVAREAVDTWEDEADLEPIYVAVEPLVKRRLRGRVVKISTPSFEASMWPSDDEIDVE